VIEVYQGEGDGAGLELIHGLFKVVTVEDR
jgi:hypothetical protein